MMMVKVVIEIVEGYQLGNYIYLILPLGLASLTFGAMVLLLTNCIYRCAEIPIIVLLQLNVNSTVIIVLLILRLIGLWIWFYPSSRRYLEVYIEISLLIILLSCYYCGDELANYIAFMAIALGFLLGGLYELKVAIIDNEYDIYSLGSSIKDEDD